MMIFIFTIIFGLYFYYRYFIYKDKVPELKKYLNDIEDKVLYKNISIRSRGLLEWQNKKGDIYFLYDGVIIISGSKIYYYYNKNFPNDLFLKISHVNAVFVSIKIIKNNSLDIKVEFVKGGENELEKSKWLNLKNSTNESITNVLIKYNLNYSYDI